MDKEPNQQMDTQHRWMQLFNKEKWILILVLLLTFSSCQKKVYVVYPTVPTTRIMPPKEEVKIVQEAPKPPLKPKKLIVIDPGHGGEDHGTQSLSKPIFTEKNLNLATAQILEQYLKQMGYHTLLTRNDDIFIALDKRALFANTNKPDLFVSVHYNSAPSPQAEGIEVFYYKTDKNKERTTESKLLAQKILNRVIENTEAKSRGVKHGDLAVVRETNMPAVLIEGGFLSNDAELQKLKNGGYIKKLAWGIAQGVQDYINLN